MLARESHGQLELDVEESGAVSFLQDPLGFRSRESSRVTLGVKHLEWDEAGFDGVRLVVQAADGVLVPASVVRGHSSLGQDQVSFLIGSDDNSCSVFSAIDVVAGVLIERISTDAAVFQPGSTAVNLVVAVISGCSKPISPS